MQDGIRRAFYPRSWIIFRSAVSGQIPLVYIEVYVAGAAIDIVPIIFYSMMERLK